MKDFEIVEHTADLKIRVYGKTYEELFANSLIGMFQCIKPLNDSCKYEDERLVCVDLPIKHQVKIESNNIEYLLVDFLNESLYLSDIYNEAYLGVNITRLNINENSNQLEATLKGIKITGFEVVEIKAVTYHDLNIQRQNEYFMTDIVFDI